MIPAPTQTSLIPAPPPNRCKDQNPERGKGCSLGTRPHRCSWGLPCPPHLGDGTHLPLEDAGVLGGGDEGRRVGDGGRAWQDGPGTVVEAQGQRVTCRTHVCPSQGPEGGRAAADRTPRTSAHLRPTPPRRAPVHAHPSTAPVPVLTSHLCPWLRHHPPRDDWAPPTHGSTPELGSPFPRDPPIVYPPHRTRGVFVKSTGARRPPAGAPCPLAPDMASRPI